MRGFTAEKAVTDPRNATAKNNALQQQRCIDHERDEALSHLTEDDRENSKRRHRFRGSLS